VLDETQRQGMDARMYISTFHLCSPKPRVRCADEQTQKHGELGAGESFGNAFEQQCHTYSNDIMTS